MESITTIKYYPAADHIKGKSPAHEEAMSGGYVRGEAEQVSPKRWTPPPAGWVKLNVDGSYHPDSRTGGIGMVLRDDTGGIIFSSCRYLFTCASPLIEAELATCREGCALTIKWSNLPCIIESDCQEMVAMLQECR